MPTPSSNTRQPNPQEVEARHVASLPPVASLRDAPPLAGEGTPVPPAVQTLDLAKQYTHVVALAGLLYGWPIGSVIGLTLFTVCSLAATVGGTMPLIAKAVRADPAVFSNPFISTFVDATGLVVYFLIAKAILGL